MGLQGRPERPQAPGCWRQRAATGPCFPRACCLGGFFLSAETPSARGSVFTSGFAPHPATASSSRPPRARPGLRSCCCRLVGDTQLCFPSGFSELLVSPVPSAPQQGICSAHARLQDRLLRAGPTARGPDEACGAAEVAGPVWCSRRLASARVSGVRALWPQSRPAAQGPAPRGPGPDRRDAPCRLARPPQLWWLLFEGLAPRPSSGSAPCLTPSVPEQAGWCSSLCCGQCLAQLLTDSLVADGQAQSRTVPPAPVACICLRMRNSPRVSLRHISASFL